MRNILLLTALLSMVGCTKDYNIGNGSSRPRYVIEGRISNLRAPYFVRVSLSNNAAQFGDRGFNLQDSAVGVQDAMVVIADDAGLKDTLKPCTEANTYGYSYYYDGGIDSVMQSFAKGFYTVQRGYYMTDKFTGVPGHTYTMSVQIGKEEFHASALMPQVPVLDSSILKKAVIATDGMQGLTPFVYFKEPQQVTNYYLLQGFNISDFPYDNPFLHAVDNSYFPYYVFDDKTLPAYVDGMMVRVIIPGSDRANGQFAFNLYPNTWWQTRLCSLTKEAYDYFSQLNRQFENDGSAYQPAPATPNGNISGGALGLFYATDVSIKLMIPE